MILITSAQVYPINYVSFLRFWKAMVCNATLTVYCDVIASCNTKADDVSESVADSVASSISCCMFITSKLKFVPRLLFNVVFLI